jgi:hypothetical protein
MGYRFSNNNSSIKVDKGTGSLLLEKAVIKEISIVREDLIKISTGSCFSALLFRHSDIDFPSLPSALSFISQLNTWINPPEPTIR